MCTRSPKGPPLTSSSPFHIHSYLVVLAHQWKHPWPRNVRRKEVPPTIAHKMTVDPSQQRNLLQSLVQVLAHLRVSDTIVAIA